MNGPRDALHFVYGIMDSGTSRPLTENKRKATVSIWQDLVAN